MIHRDLCDPVKTKYYSPLRMQFHFLLSRFHCWDGFIPLTRKEMAAELSCDIQSIDKYIKKGIEDKILCLEGDRLYLLKKVDKANPKDQEKYVKHYAFLESSAFKSLQPHTQRFILYLLWAGLQPGRSIKRLFTSLYHWNKDYRGILNLYSRKELLPILEESKQFLQIKITVNKYGKELVKIKLQDQYALEKALDNEGEKKHLTDILNDHDCEEYVSEHSVGELLKLKREYKNKFGSIGTDMFSHAIRNLMAVHQKLAELNGRGEVGKYFRGIMKDMEKKLLPTLQKRIQYINNAIFHTKSLLIDGKSQLLQNLKRNKEILEAGLNYLAKNLKDDPPSTQPAKSFPFYNWLEKNTEF